MFFNSDYRQRLVNWEGVAHIWGLHEIKQRRSTTALFLLPDSQEMEFVVHSAPVVDNAPGLHWCFYVPVSGSGTEERLLRLLKQDSK
ncbi:hypothetical protein [Paenibacillus pinistramenti]|uniref:hypothetical protein n=1 Tax=Paenibacillus pinistramenti TaxID=1768003 RepID=UPI001EF0F5D0|nr:hypothetical protein [Paenibacillus pinistramenti]